VNGFKGYVMETNRLMESQGTSRISILMWLIQNNVLKNFIQNTFDICFNPSKIKIKKLIFTQSYLFMCAKFKIDTYTFLFWKISDFFIFQLQHIHVSHFFLHFFLPNNLLCSSRVCSINFIKPLLPHTKRSIQH
jgi:hypothetical protein